MPLTGGDLGKFEEEIVKKYINDTDSPLSDYLTIQIRMRVAPGGTATLKIGSKVYHTFTNSDLIYTQYSPYYTVSAGTYTITNTCSGMASISVSTGYLIAGSTYTQPPFTMWQSSSSTITNTSTSANKTGTITTPYAYCNRFMYSACGGGGGTYNSTEYGGGGGAGCIKDSTASFTANTNASITYSLGKKGTCGNTTLYVTSGSPTTLAGIVSATYTGGTKADGGFGGAGGSPNGGKGGEAHSTTATASTVNGQSSPYASGGEGDFISTYEAHGGGGASLGNGQDASTISPRYGPGYGGGAGSGTGSTGSSCLQYKWGVSC